MPYNHFFSTLDMRATGFRRATKNSTPAASAPQMSEDLLALFRKTGALLDGHFVLRSGLHSREYFQCALLLQHTDIAAKVCGWLADKLRDFNCDTVISPALGGIIVGQEVGRSLGKRHIFARNRKANWSCAAVLKFRLTKDSSWLKTSSPAAAASRRQSTSCAPGVASSPPSA